jgi:hypothetical protein
MRHRLITLVSLAAVVAASAALAANRAKNPLQLALQPSGLPANLYTGILGKKPRPQLQDPADTEILGVAGVRAADYGYVYPADPSVKGTLGSSPKEWRLEGTVFVAPNPGKARDLFQLGKPFGTGFFSDVPGAMKDHETISLPSYGQAQTAAFVHPFPTVGPQAILFVLKGSVVWQLRLQTVSLKWKPAKTQVLAELKKYALKQKARVGSG